MLFESSGFTTWFSFCFAFLLFLIEINFLEAVGIDKFSGSTTKVKKEKVSVVFEKTERFVVDERRESKPGASAAINFKIVVKDPNTGKVVERRSTEGRGDKYIPR